MTWTGDESLDLTRPLLLEASAGTGKTWQIAHLVARFVACEGVPIDRILVITFTNAATSELRDRIRRRLVDVRACLEVACRTPEALAEADEVLVRQFCEPEGERETRLRRVHAALSGFDRASISTIHGFSQRMLDQFAFESGQEAELELVTDASELQQEYVSDLMANAYAEATEREVHALEELGFAPGRMRDLVEEMTGAVSPALRPEPSTLGDLPDTPLALARRWCAAVDSMGDFVESNAGEGALEGLASLVSANGKKLNKKTAAGAADDLRAWVAQGGRGGTIGTKARNEYLRGERATSAEEDSEYERVAPLFEAVNGALGLRERLISAMAIRVGEGARQHVDDELRRRRLLTFNTILSRLAERIVDPDSGAALAEAIRERYDVALVDEFQDTDAAQWAVLRAVFGHPSRRLLLIGDPKQAIYAFRDADIHVYLDAKHVTSAQQETMAKNFRTDASLVDAMNHLWQADSGAFLTDDVEYVKVGARHADGRVALPPCEEGRTRAALEIRWADVHTLRGEVPAGGKETMNKDAARCLAAGLCAREAAALLRSGGQFFSSKGGESRPLRARDIAVLVSSHKEGSLVQQGLAARGIASVRGGQANVFLSEVTAWLKSWLLAVAAAGRSAEARFVYTCPLFGHTAGELDAAMNEEGAEAWTEWVASLSGWLKQWSTQGFVRVFEAALDEYDVMERILRGDAGERRATDLRHLMEMCHAEERRTRVGPAGLAAWLEEQHEAEGAAPSDEQLIRLERDDDAIQIVTIWSSKGLEYPVVLLPFCSLPYNFSDKGQPLRYHEGADLCLDLHPSTASQRAEAVEASLRERREEEMRLLYVAMTRAAHHTVAWHVAYKRVSAAQTSLGRLLFRERAQDGAVLHRGAESLGDLVAKELVFEDAAPRLDRLAATSSGKLAWTRAAYLAPDDDEGAPTGERREELPTAAWTRRSLRSAFVLTSYSGLSAGSTVDVDEPAREDPAAAIMAPSATDEAATGAGAMLAEPPGGRSMEPTGVTTPEASPLPLEGMRGGTDVGTWAHAVLEHLDFQTGDGLDGTRRADLVASLGARYGVQRSQDHALLGEALPAILATVMGHPEGDEADPLRGVALADIQRAHRIDELRFDLRLGQGTDYLHQTPGSDGRVDEAEVHRALRGEHATSVREGDEHQAAYLEAVLSRATASGQAPIFWSMAGIMGGYIDLVFRVPQPGAAPHDPAAYRYYVCDYKTNYIKSRAPGAVATATQFTRPWMAWEMAHHGYYLQALVYQLALHRFLGARLGARYNPREHLGGYVYLFLRGMTGASAVLDAPAVRGVYRGAWSAELMQAMDVALDGRLASRAEGGAP